MLRHLTSDDVFATLSFIAFLGACVVLLAGLPA